MALKSKFIEKEFAYDGTQLRSLFGYLDHKLLGDSVVSWVGPCAISFEHMVDGEDLLEEAVIAGSRMLHFIVEKFHVPLWAGVTLQRLMAAVALEAIREMATETVAPLALRRSGDDLYFNEGKLSISIATASPVSSLVHFAINCTNEGTPVKTSSLEDLGIEPRAFAEVVMKRLVQEMDTIDEASMKVRWVR